MSLKFSVVCKHTTLSVLAQRKKVRDMGFISNSAIPLLTSEFHGLENEVRKSMTGSKDTSLLWWAAAL